VRYTDALDDDPDELSLAPAAGGAWDVDARRATGNVLQTRIDARSLHAVVNRLLNWARLRESRYVAICNVHVVVTASRNAAYRDVINAADMAAPDGAPVAWMLRRQGFARQSRVAGPDLMEALCERCAAEGVAVYLYGSTAATLEALKVHLHDRFPRLVIAGFESPPFGAVSADDDRDTVDRINGSGAQVVFVGLGCPKQEAWMAAHRGRINAVMVGVGAAFDFHAGILRRAPLWMRHAGLEWLHRLAMEPRRLWKRYLVTNTLFIVGATKQLLAQARPERTKGN